MHHRIVNNSTGRSLVLSKGKFDLRFQASIVGCLVEALAVLPPAMALANPK
jgi:hypothetical protein